MNIDAVAMLQLLQLTSPSLPVGGFAWSQGLEYAIEQAWLKDEADLCDWLESVLAQNFTFQEWPLLQRLSGAAMNQDWDELIRWNRHSLAMRETAELREEDRQMGAALIRLLNDLGVKQAQDWPEHEISYLTAFAMAASSRTIPLDAAGFGFAWSWLENQIAVAIKTFLMGQTAGQRVFQTLVARIPIYWERSLCVKEEEMGCSLPGLVMSSMLHEQQYSRLFRS